MRLLTNIHTCNVYFKVFKDFVYYYFSLVSFILKINQIKAKFQSNFEAPCKIDLLTQLFHPTIITITLLTEIVYKLEMTHDNKTAHLDCEWGIGNICSSKNGINFILNSIIFFVLLTDSRRYGMYKLKPFLNNARSISVRYAIYISMRSPNT